MAETIGALVASGVAASGTAAGGTAAAAVAGSSFAAGAVSTAGFGAATAGTVAGGGLFSAGNLALGSTILSGVTSIMGGFMQAGSLRAQAQMYANDAEEMKRAALVEEQARLKRLNSMLDTNRAIAAAKGYDPSSSASFRAAEDENTSEGLADINAAKLNTLNRASRLQWQSNIFDSDATGAMIGGVTRAAGSLIRYAAR